MQELKFKLDNILLSKVKDIKENSNKLNYISANKSGKHLASVVKRTMKRNNISLKDESSNQIITNNKIINNEFRLFYKKLYSSEIKDEDPISFLKSINLKRLLQIQKEELRKDFTNIEIEDAINTLPSKKAPGMDGLPFEFYSTFWSSISPLFMEVIRSFVNNHKLPETMYLSTISVIPKPGRDCNKPSDFRPISLINCDKKIITKVINNRLTTILPSIIHHDQSGFIPNRDLKTKILYLSNTICKEI